MKKVLLLAFSTVFVAPAFAADAKVTYPEGFRAWKHVKSMEIKKGHALYDAVGGIHHIYGNDKAMKGYKANNQFGNGSVIVFDLFEVMDKDNATAEGARKAVIVMAKDGKKFATTGGWGFEVFDPKTKKGTLDAKAAGECFGCHQQVKDQGFVFSKLRD